MRIKSLVAGVAIACAAISAHAGEMGVALNETAPGFWAADFDSDFLELSTIHNGVPGNFSDKIYFQDFLHSMPVGQYEVQLTFHEIVNTGTTGVTTKDPIINEVISFDGQSVSMPVGIRGFYQQFFTSLGTGKPSFVLDVAGLTTASQAGYHGTITVTAVPEPETYAMFLAGLGILGAIARRRKQA